MKKLLIGLLVFVLVGCSRVQPEQSTRTIVDFNKQSVTLNQDIKRAVVANRYLLDIVRGIGAIEQVIAIDSQAYENQSYWPEFSSNDIYGKGITDLDYEKLATYKPDVFITIPEFYNDEFAAKMKEINIPVVVVSVAMAQDEITLEQIALLGEVFQQNDGAKRVQDFYTGVRDSIQERLQLVKDKPKVYIEFKNPYATGLPGTTWSRMIDAAGGQNALGEDDGVKGQWEAEPEAVITSNPDLVVKTVYRLDGKDSYIAPESTAYQDTLNEMKTRNSFSLIPAIQEQSIVLASDFVFRGGFNTVGMAYMAKWIHPEVFADFDADAIFNEWMTEFQNLDIIEGHVMDLRNAE